jgi:hypothetical protein
MKNIFKKKKELSHQELANEIANNSKITKDFKKRYANNVWKHTVAIQGSFNVSDNCSGQTHY